MKLADLSDLKNRLTDLARRSPVAGQVKDILLEPDSDADGEDFLRIIVEIKNFEGIKDADMEALTVSIENTVSDMDERFPSVRFAEAA